MAELALTTPHLLAHADGTPKPARIKPRRRATGGVRQRPAMARTMYFESPSWVSLVQAAQAPRGIHAERTRMVCRAAASDTTGILSSPAPRASSAQALIIDELHWIVLGYMLKRLLGTGSLPVLGTLLVSWCA